ncbi:MAG: isoprenylcysteine carboxylmethyltransferase family protein [Promethearchaeota archaeon]
MFEEMLFRLLLATIWIIFAGVRIYYRRKSTRPIDTDEANQTKKKQKLGWLFLVLAIGLLGTIISIIVYLLMPLWILWFPLPLPSIVRWIGAVLGFCTIPFLVWIHRTLGRFWSAELEIKKNHTLMTNGPYSRVRHPMYTVFILFTLSALLIAANLFVTVFAIIVILMFYPISLKEEELLLDQFGDKYRNYMERTGRFLPRIRQVKILDSGQGIED